jgi:hypothetical protein
LSNNSKFNLIEGRQDYDCLIKISLPDVARDEKKVKMAQPAQVDHQLLPHCPHQADDAHDAGSGVGRQIPLPFKIKTRLVFNGIQKTLI